MLLRPLCALLGAKQRKLIYQTSLQSYSSVTHDNADTTTPPLAQLSNPRNPNGTIDADSRRYRRQPYRQRTRAGTHNRPVYRLPHPRHRALHLRPLRLKLLMRRVCPVAVSESLPCRRHRGAKWRGWGIRCRVMKKGWGR